MDYTKLSLDELRAEIVRLSDEQNKIQEQKLAISKIIDIRLIEDKIKSTVANMSDTEKEIMASQIVGVSTAKSVAKSGSVK